MLILQHNIPGTGTCHSLRDDDYNSQQLHLEGPMKRFAGKCSCSLYNFSVAPFTNKWTPAKSLIYGKVSNSFDVAPSSLVSDLFAGLGWYQDGGNVTCRGELDIKLSLRSIWELTSFIFHLVCLLMFSNEDEKWIVCFSDIFIFS